MKRSTCVLAGLFVLYFIVAGVLLLPYPGMENDEALFAGGIYAPEQMEWYTRIFGKSICVMIMTYIGALKAWLYVPIFALWQPWSFSLRLPMVLAGAGAVWLFAALLNRLYGPRAAIFGAALLAADSVFLTTVTFDWGPVALQQLFCIAALFLLVRFYQQRRERDLWLGFFLLGFTLWNKAVFIWILAGLGTASLVMLHRILRQLLSRRTLLVATSAFLIGAAPLVIYNLVRSGATLTGKRYSLSDVQQKVTALHATMNGDAMAGFLVSANATGHERPPDSLAERASLWLSDFNGRRMTGVLPYALLIALIAGLWSSRSRKILVFFMIAFLVAWAQMLITVEAGGGAHHTITLWPLLYAIVARRFGEYHLPAPRRAFARYRRCFHHCRLQRTGYERTPRAAGPLRTRTVMDGRCIPADGTPSGERRTAGIRRGLGHGRHAAGAVQRQDSARQCHRALHANRDGG